MSTNLENNADYYIAKHNNLIFAKMDMTLLEQKLVLIAISCIKPEDTSFSLLQFKIKDIANLLGLTADTLYTDLKKTVKKLMTRVLELQEGKDWVLLHIVSKAKSKNKLGMIELEIHHDMREYLLEVKKNYTSYQLKNILKLSSSYSIRIYEMCVAELYRGALYLTLDELREFLKLSKSYKSFGNVNSRILKTAEKEINEKTDIKITIHPDKEGKKVVGIKIHIEKRLGIVSNKQFKQKKEKKDKKEEEPKQLSFSDTTETSVIEKVSKQKNNNLKFNNFEQRVYDYDDLERKLLGWDKDDEEDYYE